MIGFHKVDMSHQDCHIKKQQQQQQKEIIQAPDALQESLSKPRATSLLASYVMG